MCGGSSDGRAAVSKTAGQGLDSLPPRLNAQTVRREFIGLPEICPDCGSRTEGDRLVTCRICGFAAYKSGPGRYQET